MDDLYTGNSYIGESETDGNAAMIYRMDKIDEGLRKVYKNKSKKKRGKKKFKKLRRENEQLRYMLQMFALQKSAENEKINYFMEALAMQQNTAQKKPKWWQQAIVNSVPQTINAVAAAFNMASKFKNNTRTDKNQSVFYLTEGNGKK